MSREGYIRDCRRCSSKLMKLNDFASDFNLDTRFSFIRETQEGVEFSTELFPDSIAVIGSKRDFSKCTYSRKLCDGKDFELIADALTIFFEEEFGAE